MAKVIKFYVPDRLREKRLWNPPEQRGKVIEFPPTEITGVNLAVEKVTKPPSCTQSMVAYEIRINAPTSLVYECLLRSDFNEAWLVRLLMTVRSGTLLPRSRVPTRHHGCSGREIVLAYVTTGTARLPARLHCPPVGTPAGVSARFRLDIRIAVLRSLCFSAGSLGVVSGILRASLLCAGAGAPDVN